MLQKPCDRISAHENRFARQKRHTEEQNDHQPAVCLHPDSPHPASPDHGPVCRHPGRLRPVGPDYVQPPIDVPATYKEDSLWKTAKPSDEYPRGAWWSVFKDPELDRLMVLLNKQNLTIAAAEAQYRRRRPCCDRHRSSLFPSLSLDASRTRGFQSNTSTSASTQNAFVGNLSWEVDIWGGVRRNVEAGEAGRQASAAQLEAIKLSSQAQMATGLPATGHH